MFIYKQNCVVKEQAKFKPWLIVCPRHIYMSRAFYLLYKRKTNMISLNITAHRPVPYLLESALCLVQ